MIRPTLSGQHPAPYLARLRLDEETPHVDALRELLSEAERGRAERFVRKADMQRFVIGRGRLREALALRLGQQPQDVRFKTNAFGKPLLDVPGAAPHFSLSHSGDWILFAIDEQSPVGVDVESVRAEVAQIEHLHWVLAAEEQRWLDRLPETHRASAFARAWVRKEAYVKALGVGVSRNLEAIAIVDGSEGEPRLLYDRNDTPLSWRFIDLTLDSRHVGCLVHRQDDSACCVSSVRADAPR
jgi:4'-phosphopantetheinyl transferase